MNIYVGNFSKEVTEDDIKEVFGAFGQVDTVKIIMDQYSGESRGFGFVEMPSKKEALDAMEGIKDIKGRMVTINEARPRAERGRGGSGGRGRRDSGQRSGGGFRSSRY